MKRLTLLSFVWVCLPVFIAGTSWSAEAPDPARVDQQSTDEKSVAADARRKEIPLGGDFQPNPKTPVITAVAHGMRIVLSRDDGKTWKQVFFGHPSGDHSPWATFDMAYTDGVFVGFGGWGAAGRGSFIASEDGVNWRHLTGKDRTGRYDPRGMEDAFGGAAGNGTIMAVGGGFQITRDFGKTWERFTTTQLDPPIRSAHLKALFCNDDGDEGGRFVVVGDGPQAFISRDNAKTWTVSRMKPDAATDKRGLYRDMAYGNGILLVADDQGLLVHRSADRGQTWTSHEHGAVQPTASFSSLSYVKGEFWLTGKQSRASQDGITWRNLPESTPQGKVIVTDRGTLISVHRNRPEILRSSDGKTWETVHSLTEEEMRVPGGRQGFVRAQFGYVNAMPAK